MNEQQQQLASILGSNQNAAGSPPRFSNPQMQYSKQPFYNGNNSLLQNTPYNNYMNPYQQSQISNSFFKCRPVSSREEARACQIDLDGSLWVFTDQAHNKIYTKQIQNDGSCAFKTYVYQEENENNYGDEYVTKNDLAKTVEYIISLLPAQSTQANSKNEKTSSTNF